MRRELLLNIYVITISVGTVLYFIFGLIPHVDPVLVSMSFLIWSLLVVIAELTPITLPRGNASLSVGGAIDFGIILLFPTVLAAIAGALSGLVSSLYRKVDKRKMIFNISMSSLVLIIPSEIVRIYGIKLSELPAFNLSEWPINAILLPYFVAAMSYYVINTGLTSGAISLDVGGNIWEIWRTNYLWTIASSMATALIGFILASIFHILYSGKAILGILGLSIFIIPLIVIRSSFISFINANKAYYGSIKALISALDASHHYTQGHSRRVADNAMMVGRALRLPGKVIEAIEKGATLHDLGKIGMDNSVLDKRGPLSNVEWARMKQHPILGSQIISELTFLEKAREIVLHHHERIDGKGYPMGLKGDQIPVGARIVNAVDALDALTSQRSYREALNPTQAIEMLESNSGKQFDVEVVKNIRALFEQGDLVFYDAEESQESEILFTACEVLEALPTI